MSFFVSTEAYCEEYPAIITNGFANADINDYSTRVGDNVTFECLHG